MGFSKKSQIDGGFEPEGKKWVIAGLPARSSLKPITTKSRAKDGDDDGEKSRSTTPTAKEARIPEKLSCPAAPRKRRSLKSSSNQNHGREFFNPPDLESVFKIRV
ncbi:cyclin-dependent protein kinase inhibitor SMR6 [Cucurbita pepo subsp. pepo]|uniref:cyclin-dependent protein kinase inhibitor SMR6 n=1 Tax=Cucurbita pepo subsp. pepo TaxID=3664 RepID=UPI000C9D6D0A|nr:cyclin-dependent protein kinase inhibitor SMR6 [Cucurbita pepo subsp. pepo]